MRGARVMKAPRPMTKMPADEPQRPRERAAKRDALVDAPTGHVADVAGEQRETAGGQEAEQARAEGQEEFAEHDSRLRQTTPGGGVSGYDGGRPGGPRLYWTA